MSGSPTGSGASADRWLAKAFGESSISVGRREGGVRDSRTSVRSEVRTKFGSSVASAVRCSTVTFERLRVFEIGFDDGDDGDDER